MAGIVQKLRIDQTIVDHVVQRTVDEIRVNGIIANYNPAALGVIVVNHRADGSYHVIDGGHRRAALLRMQQGSDEVDALVYEGLSVAEEALMFRQLNTRRSVHPLDMFRVRVIEGDPAAVALNDLVKSYGWIVLNGQKKNAFAAVGTLEAIYKGPKMDEQNLALCRRILDTIYKAWGTETSGVKSEILKGLALFYRRFGLEADDMKLASELSGYNGGPRNFIGGARGIRDMYKGTMGDAVAEKLVILHNTGRRRKLPAWRSA